MVINKLEELRKTGNFTPNKPFDDSVEKKIDKQLSNESNLEKDEKKRQKNVEVAKYIPSTNQRKTLKVSNQTKAEIEELKRQLKMGFNYEVIQYLIDNYVDTTLSTSQKRRFRENTEN